ncbi:MAG: hypothetical protein HC812_12965, partial [Leptolyngbya sp. RL_3_1]|nr:hypothetical protein [Leptolyngbya sp. RL_3_1]
NEMLQAGPPGYVQLAGGTIIKPCLIVSTIQRGRSQSGRSADRPLSGRDTPRVDHLCRPIFGGVAYGSYARKLLQPVFSTLDMDGQPMFSAQSQTMLLEDFPDLLERAIQQCQTLIAPLKGWHSKAVDPPLPPVIV